MENQLIKKKSLEKIDRILFTVPLMINDGESLLKKGFTFALYLADSFKAALTTLIILEELSPSAKILVSKFLTKKERDDLKMKNEAEIIEKARRTAERYCIETMEEIENCPYIAHDIKVGIGSVSSVIEETVLETGSDLVLIDSGNPSHYGNAAKKTGVPLLLLP